MVNLFRVSFLERSDYVQDNKPAARRGVTMKQDDNIVDQFNISFHHMNINRFDASCLSSQQMYIISTPFSVYLWVGRNTCTKI